MKHKLKMGMVGGGGNATIGVIHKMAAQLDGKIELVAGTFSSNAERSRQSGETLGLHPSRVYSDYRTMAEEEAKLSKGERIDFVSVVIEAARAIEAETSAQRIPESCDFPRVEDGVAGMAFVDAALQSAENGGVWTKVKKFE
jgi:hypothetical protein